MTYAKLGLRLPVVLRFLESYSLRPSVTGPTAAAPGEL